MAQIPWDAPVGWRKCPDPSAFEVISPKECDLILVRLLQTSIFILFTCPVLLAYDQATSLPESTRDERIRQDGLALAAWRRCSGGARAPDLSPCPGLLRRCWWLGGHLFADDTLAKVSRMLSGRSEPVFYTEILHTRRPRILVPRLLASRTYEQHRHPPILLHNMQRIWVQVQRSIQGHMLLWQCGTVGKRGERDSLLSA